MTKRLEGKVAVITGGSSGIGLATAKRFVADGVTTVFITGRRQDQLDKAVAEIGGNAIGVQADVSKVEDIKKLFLTVKKTTGSIDILFCNAGIGENAVLGEISEDLFDRIFSINVKGIIFTVQEFIPLLSKGGSIILTSSITSGKGLRANSVYAATKAAIRSLARTWTAEFKARATTDHGEVPLGEADHDKVIRVNVVSPGPIETPMLLNGLSTEIRNVIKSHVPLGRLAQPSEISSIVSFLASDESSFIAGADVQADGGLTQI
ncbi:DEKNAAC101441 [Brettanomyces naardenensis]|uniref:DEKNAAC101441 n=1 Tax=Brettanomyces naardenensis TaxID=13370 RepID=A0A448YI30_BRENA|nr:DEKNAAC101441 [Brettanomyces naardenensis]